MRSINKGWMACAAAAALLAGAAASASAAGKFGYVDVEKIFERYQRTVDLNEKLQGERKERITERKSLVEEINKLKDEADLLSDEAKRKKDAAVDEKVKALYAFEEKVKREALQKQARLQEEILGEIKGVIAELGKGEGYDMIFAVTKDEVGWYAAPLDLTEKVVKTLNARFGEAKK